MSKGRFIIVEDEFVVAENLRAELVSMGYEFVGMASTGEKAIALARREKPDLALMDIKLIGEMDGVETAIHLRQQWDIPVLFLTAFADETILERAKLAEPLGYLVKPYNQKGFRASVEMAHYKAIAISATAATGPEVGKSGADGRCDCPPLQQSAPCCDRKSRNGHGRPAPEC
jgi:DNA-binding NarL/FixJ family response regulator